MAYDPAHESTRRLLQHKLLKLRQEYDDGTADSKKSYPEMHEQYRLFWDNYR